MIKTNNWLLDLELEQLKWEIEEESRQSETDTNEYEHTVWIGEDVTPRVLNNDDRDEDDG